MRSSTFLLAAASAVSNVCAQDSAYGPLSGRPIVAPRYSDPGAAFYNSAYWVFATTKDEHNYEKSLDVIVSSDDLVSWTTRSNVLNVKDFTWANTVGNPSPLFHNGSYYVYFSSHGSQSSPNAGGIGVGVANKPEGPYKDAIGAPLIKAVNGGAQPVDPSIFIDGNGQAYLYYGDKGHATVAKLNSDLISLGNFGDGKTFKQLGLSDFAGGINQWHISSDESREKKYNLFYNTDVGISFVSSDSAEGPYTSPKAFKQSDTVGKDYRSLSYTVDPSAYVPVAFYHYRPLSSTDRDETYLTWIPVAAETNALEAPPSLVVDDFQDNNSVGWTTYGGKWSVVDKTFQVEAAPISAALLDVDEDSSIGGSALFNLTSAPTGDVGYIWSVSDFKDGAFKGYYASINNVNVLTVARSDGVKGNFTTLAQTTAPKAGARPGTTEISILGTQDGYWKFYVGKYSNSPVITIKADTTYTHGKEGFLARNTAAYFYGLNTAGAD